MLTLPNGSPRSLLRILRGVAPEGGTHCIRPGYYRRLWPAYHRDIDTEVTWQPDVYAEVDRLALHFGSRIVVDLGCGSATKLMALSAPVDTIGLDVGSNLRRARELHPQGVWVEHDIDSDTCLPLTGQQLTRSVVVCADVIEHLRRPRMLLRTLRQGLDYCDAVVLSTPEREVTWGADHNGPPPNPAHVREWSLPELAALLWAEGFRFGHLGLTRSNDRSPLLSTILAVLLRSGPPLSTDSSADVIGRADLG